jgi:hypothetical protein
MLIEVAGGATPSGDIRVEITSLVRRDAVLRVKATLKWPEMGKDDIGHPFAVVATPIWDRPMVLDLFEIRDDVEDPALQPRWVSSHAGTVVEQ